MLDETPRLFRFGVQVAAADDPAAWADRVRRAAALGDDVLALPDHTPPGVPGSPDLLMPLG